MSINVMEFTSDSRFSFFSVPGSDKHYHWSRNRGNLVQLFAFFWRENVFNSIRLAKLNLTGVCIVFNPGLGNINLDWRSFCQHWGALEVANSFHFPFLWFSFASQRWIWQLSFRIMFAVHCASCLKKLGFADKEIGTMCLCLLSFWRNSHFERKKDTMVQVNVEKVADVWNEKVSFGCHCKWCLDHTEDQPLVK